MKFKLKQSSKILIVAALTSNFILDGCSGGGSVNAGSNAAPQNGYLSASYDGNQEIRSIQVTNGSIQKVFISLKGSTGVIGQKVNIDLSNQNIATVSPKTCALSSGSNINSTCMVTINGNSLGNTSLIVSSSGYSGLTLPTTTQSSPVYGQFEVESSDGYYYSGESAINGVNASYPISTQQITINAGIFGSSGIESTNSAVLNFAIESTNGATLNPNASQACGSITTVNNTCTATKTNPIWSVSGTPSAPIQLKGTVAGAILAGIVNPYSPITVFESAAAPNVGKIVVSTQSGNIVPFGMHAPVFVNWIKGEQTGQVTLTLTSSNPSAIQFYAYNESGIKNTFATTPTCTLNSPFESLMSCGYGVEAMSASGSSTITATIVSKSLNVPTIESLVLTINAQEAPIRTLKFTNNSQTKPIWIGITQGGANAYTSPAQDGQSVTTTHDLTPGAVSWCGLNNPRAACPVGSTCRPGGANAGGVMFCYWDALVPVGGSYLMESNGGSVTVNISGSSSDPNGIIWSGNFFARTKCNESGVCEVGSCGNGTGLACAPGTGASPGGVVTLGELTFQKNNNPDYYDVSIINGVNFGLQFGPDQESNPASPLNAYTCGVAGSIQNQGSWPSSTGLPAATWLMKPESTSIYPFDGSVANPQIYYSWVDGDENSQKCSAESCTGGLVCGYHLNSVYSSESGINQGTNSVYQQYCGHRIAWLTADSIAGFNKTESNGASSYFNLNQFWTNPVESYPTTPSRGNNNIYVTNLQLCNMNTFSSYQNPAPAGSAGNSVLACGGVDWSNYNGQDVTRINSGFTLVTPNPNWVSNVLPTIGWLKTACPTCYTYPFDDPTSTFTCTPAATAGNSAVYNATFGDLSLPD